VGLHIIIIISAICHNRFIRNVGTGTLNQLNIVKVGSVILGDLGYTENNESGNYLCKFANKNQVEFNNYLDLFETSKLILTRYHKNAIFSFFLFLPPIKFFNNKNVVYINVYL
jgi:hypothetical protein